MSRMITGAMPSTISTTLETSPRPHITKMIGSTAIGGISDSTATVGAKVLRTSGNIPSIIPNTSPDAVLIPTPQARRCRLARVSLHRMIWPVRLSSWKATRRTPSASWLTLGSRRSLGFAAWRASEADT